MRKFKSYHYRGLLSIGIVTNISVLLVDKRNMNNMIEKNTITDESSQMEFKSKYKLQYCKDNLYNSKNGCKFHTNTNDHYMFPVIETC